MVRSSRLLAVSAALVLGLVGTAGAETGSEPPGTRLFLANEGANCGTGDAPFLTTAARTTDINCGYIGGGLPFGEVFHQSGLVESGRSFSTKATEAALPLVVDVARDATGVVVVRSGSQQGVALPGTGQVVADVAVRVRVGRQTIELGAQTLEGTAVGGQTVSLPFTVDLPEGLAGLEVTGVQVDLNVRGAHLFHGFMNLNGNTYLDVPTVPAPVEEAPAP